VHFFATQNDDTNYRVDDVDATSIRNQNMRLNSRLLMSEDAIAEFRVNSALFTAESGGSIGGQVEVVTKSGTNALHGSAFEYARNAVFDVRRFTAVPIQSVWRQRGRSDHQESNLLLPLLRRIAAEPGSAGRGPERSIPRFSRPGAGTVARDCAAAGCLSGPSDQLCRWRPPPKMWLAA
jgi:hypothetical protein